MLSLFALAMWPASPFLSSVFRFVAKLCKIFAIFYSCEKKTMKLSLLHRNVDTFSPRKDILMAQTAVYQFQVMTKSSR